MSTTFFRSALPSKLIYLQISHLLYAAILQVVVSIRSSFLFMIIDSNKSTGISKISIPVFQFLTTVAINETFYHDVRFLEAVIEHKLTFSTSYPHFTLIALRCQIFSILLIRSRLTEPT